MFSLSFEFFAHVWNPGSFDVVLNVRIDFDHWFTLEYKIGLDS